jgi:hypothetical protein
VRWLGSPLAYRRGRSTRSRGRGCECRIHETSHGSQSTAGGDRVERAGLFSDSDRPSDAASGVTDASPCPVLRRSGAMSGGAPESLDDGRSAGASGLRRPGIVPEPTGSGGGWEIFPENSVYSHDRPKEYPFGKPSLRMPKIPRPDKEFRKARAGIRFPNRGLPARTFPPGYPGGSGDSDGSRRAQSAVEGPIRKKLFARTIFV